MDDVKVTKLWIERFVIGLGLCPFAHYSFYGNTIYYEVSIAQTPKDCLKDLMNVVVRMQDAPQSEISNSFLIFDSKLSFGDMLSIKERFDDLQEEKNGSDDFQIVVFHPDFQFGDELFDAPGNFTNRSPLPMMHILREEEVAHAIEETKDVDKIPFRNKEILERLEIKKISEVFEDDFMDKIKRYI